MLAAIGRLSFRHRRVVLVAWLAFLLGANGLSQMVGPVFDDSFNIPASESRDGFAKLDEYYPDLGNQGFGGTIVFHYENGIRDPQVQQAMQEMFQAVREIEHVSVVDPYEDPFNIHINGDETMAYAEVAIEGAADQTLGEEIGDQIVALRPELDGLQVEIGGQFLAGFETPQSEMIGLAFAIVVLIVAFGSVLAMGLPISVALFGVGTGIGLIGLLSRVVAMPDVGSVVGAMLGLGVGIDYALFIVTRYREGLAYSQDPEQSVVVAIDSSGRAVVFAGLTVVISLLGMLLIGLGFISGLAIASATTVAVTMVASVTLLPALLGFAALRIEVTRWRGLIAAILVALALLGYGTGINILLISVPLAVVVLIAGLAVPQLKAEVPKREPKPIRATLPYRWSRLVQRHPVIGLVVGGILLAIFAIPVFSLRLGFSDEGNFPPDSTTRKAYDLLAEGFGEGFNGPLIVIAETESNGGFAVATEISNAIGEHPGVAQAYPAFPSDMEAPLDAPAYLIQVIPTSSPQDEATNELVHELRSDVLPALIDGSDFQVSVTGVVATEIDFTDYLAGRIFVFFGAVLALSFVFLMAVFRSLVVPIKAVFMNLLSIAAAYGIVVAVFQWGWLGTLFNVQPAPIEPFVPMMLFAIVFGLSMDYEVFLLSRIKEEYDRSHNAALSVADGLAATARVITAAAAIMVVVFASFIFDGNRIIKLFGLGLATAVLLDASIVRMLLVPSTMELLGHKNWWLPKWLDRILPRLNVEGGSEGLKLSPASAEGVTGPDGP